MTSNMVGLKEIADALREIRAEMKAMATPKYRARDDAFDYIKGADLRSCKVIVDALRERVSELVGCADELEDASCALQFEIERIENPCPPHCGCDNCVAARSDEHYDRKFVGGK